MLDVRDNNRFEFPYDKVEYAFGPFSSDEIFEADLINASETGLCIRSPHRLTVGLEITLRNFMGYSSRSAVVIWIAEDEGKGGFDKFDEVLFKVGLQFSNYDSESRT